MFGYKHVGEEIKAITTLKKKQQIRKQIELKIWVIYCVGSVTFNNKKTKKKEMSLINKYTKTCTYIL